LEKGKLEENTERCKATKQHTNCFLNCLRGIKNVPVNVKAAIICALDMIYKWWISGGKSTHISHLSKSKDTWVKVQNNLV
jgi:hypothetical protein